jgi:N-acetylglucosamine kinase-like BadF-type ATPase
MDMNRYLIGIDGGGTKTEGVLCRPSGEVLARVVRGASNPNDIGIEAAISVIADVMRALSEPCGDGEYRCFAGIAGALNHRDALKTGLSALFPDMLIEIGSDVQNLLTSEIPIGDGACIVSGTGSACFVRIGETLHRIGGWGYLLDTAGSGYDIGRSALSRALKAHDGRMGETSLTGILERKLGKTVAESLTEIYAGGKPFIASLAPAVLEAAEKGDADAYAIVEESIAAWCEMLTAAHGLLGKSFRAALGGGIFRNHAWLAIDLAMELSIPVDVSVALAPPVYGAFLECARRAEVGDLGEKPMKDAFLGSYEKLCGDGKEKSV